jgi:hypothetical protein
MAERLRTPRPLTFIRAQHEHRLRSRGWPPPDMLQSLPPPYSRIPLPGSPARLRGGHGCMRSTDV